MLNDILALHVWKKAHSSIYSPKTVSALCENQETQNGFLIGFVICLILLIVSVAVNIIQFCISSRKQSRQGKISQAAYSVYKHAQDEALPFSQLKVNRLKCLERWFNGISYIIQSPFSYHLVTFQLTECHGFIMWCNSI